MRSKLPASKVKLEYVTHINHAFAWPRADGTITGYTDLNQPELFEEVHRAGRKILISLGGWGQSDDFSSMAADSAARANFVRNLLAYLADKGYDGADFDWEYPQNSRDRASQVSLMKEVREAFDNVDDSRSLSLKCQYVKENGLSGVMIWALGQDMFALEQPLMEAVGRAMSEITLAKEREDKIPKQFELFDNYPNPWRISGQETFQSQGVESA